jgi:hypothetical protein
MNESLLFGGMPQTLLNGEVKMTKQDETLEEFPLGIYEVTFLVEVEDPEENFVDVSSTHIVATSIEQCLSLAGRLKTLEGGKVLRIEGIEMLADHFYLPRESDLFRGHVPSA